MKKSAKPPVRKGKKVYQAPRLTTHGDVAKLTLHPGKRNCVRACPGSAFVDDRN
jgi:hypothetical protein